MRLIGINDMDILLSGFTDFFCQDHVYSIGTLHEYLESDPGEFRVAQLDIEFDTTKNFYNYYQNYIKPRYEENKVRLAINYDGNWIFNGYAVDAFPKETPNKTIKFTFESGHGIASDYIFPQYSNLNDEVLPLSSMVHWPFNGVVERLTDSIDLTGLSYFSKDLTGLSDIALDTAYFKDDAQDGLSFLGDLCRSFAAVLLRKNNFEFEIIDRTSLVNQTPVVLNVDDIYSPYEEFEWSRHNDLIGINSVYRRTDHAVSVGMQDSVYNKNSVISLEANILANIKTYFNGAQQLLYDWIKTYIYNKYVAYFSKITSGVSFFVEGLNHRPGTVYAFEDKKVDRKSVV